MSNLEADALDRARSAANCEIKADDFAIYGSPAPIVISSNGLFVRKRSNPDKGGQYRVADENDRQVGWIAFNHPSDAAIKNGITDLVLLQIIEDHLNDENTAAPCSDYQTVLLSLRLAITTLENTAAHAKKK